MKITSTSRSRAQPARDHKYPFIGVARLNGLMVLFQKDSVGVVVSKGSSERHEIGESSRIWNMARFEPFYGEITITSEPD